MFWDGEGYVDRFEGWFHLGVLEIRIYGLAMGLLRASGQLGNCAAREQGRDHYLKKEANMNVLRSPEQFVVG